MTTDSKHNSVRALSALNFFVADVQNGMGPYMTLFLQASMGWNPAQIGAAMATGNIAQVLAQTPAGALIDQLRQKRQLIVVGSLMILIGCLGIVLLTVRPVVLGGQVLIGVAGAIFPPCLAAITLGLVGRERMDRQTGRNQAFNAAGNMTAAVALGAIGYFLGRHWMFYFVAVLSVLAIVAVLRIRAEDIDYSLARGADPAEENVKSSTSGETEQNSMGAADSQTIGGEIKSEFRGFGELLKDKRLLVFVAAAVLFHFANAAMVPLVTEMLSGGKNAKYATLYTSGLMAASQLVFIGVAAAAGRLAGAWGRKPLFLLGFAALALRGLMYTQCHTPLALIAVQCMDGLGAGIFGVVGVLIIADLTKGTGRFNVAQGAIATAQGTGAFLSNAVSGVIAKHAGHDAAFLTLAAVAAAGLVFFWRFMPETRPDRTPEPTDTPAATAQPA